MKKANSSQMDLALGIQTQTAAQFDSDFGRAYQRLKFRRVSRLAKVAIARCLPLVLVTGKDPSTTEVRSSVAGVLGELLIKNNLTLGPNSNYKFRDLGPLRSVVLALVPTRKRTKCLERCRRTDRWPLTTPQRRLLNTGRRLHGSPDLGVGPFPASASVDSRIFRLTVLMYRAMHRKLALCELAGATGLSVSRLHRLFHNQTGMSPTGIEW